MKINRKNLLIFLIIFLILILLLGWCYVVYINKVSKNTELAGNNISNDTDQKMAEEEREINHLIAGVPYYGFYNIFFQLRHQDLLGEPTTISSVKDVLGYWGDSRFSLSDLISEFNLNSTSTIKVDTVRQFFLKNGYEAEVFLGPEAKIEQIKKYVNPIVNVPVIVLQRRSLDPQSTINGYRVVIGVFDSDQKLILHDYNLGNNYEISYNDFERMYAKNAQAILAVWPAKELLNKIQRVDKSDFYPNRLEAMDKLGWLLIVKYNEAMKYFQHNQSKEAFSLYQEFINDDDFDLLPRAYQVTILTKLADLYSSSNQLDKAMRIIEEKVLPINQNLGEVPEGWYKPQQDKFAYPYLVLCRAYIVKGDKEKAMENYEVIKGLKVVDEEWHETILSQLETELGRLK